MLKDNQILDAINAQLCKRFPERMCYVNLQPQDFERPSFFIRSGEKKSVPATRTTRTRTETYYITNFEPVDEQGASELMRLSEVQAQVAALFYMPFPCEDRWLTAVPTAQEVSMVDNAVVRLVIKFHDDVIDGELPPFEPPPLMRTVRGVLENNDYSEVITDGTSHS